MFFEVVYTIQYPNNLLKNAVKRLACSIASIYNQGVRIYVLNTSEKDIYEYIKDFSNITYIHKPKKQIGIKCKSINHIVKKYIKSEYFLLSDIDIIYPINYIEIVSDRIRSLEETHRKPIRLYPNIYNHTKEYYCPDFKYLKENIPYNTDDIAPGIGAVHTQSFKFIRGYDEHMIGYGPEDALFNERLSKINYLVAAKDIKTSHLYHSYRAMIQENKNKHIYDGKMIFLNKIGEKFGQIPYSHDMAYEIQSNDETWGEL